MNACPTSSESKPCTAITARQTLIMEVSVHVRCGYEELHFGLCFPMLFCSLSFYSCLQFLLGVTASTWLRHESVTYTIFYCLIQLLKECGVPSIFNAKFKPQCTTSRMEIHRRDDTFQFYLYRGSEVSELYKHNYLFYQLFYY